MQPFVASFFDAFSATFSPSVPYRGESGKRWLVSGVWSEDMRNWLRGRYFTTFEFPVPGGLLRLDAAIQLRESEAHLAHNAMDIALEWEWDNNKVFKDFPTGDFRKLLEVDAACGVAVVQTRADGRRGTEQSEGTVERIRDARRRFAIDDRPMGLIECRRILESRHQVAFDCVFHDLDGGTDFPTIRWKFPS